MQPFKPYFMGEEEPPRPPPDVVPEVLPHDRHRERGHDRAAPHVLRDARQLLDRRLLQAGRGGLRLRALHRGFGLRPRGHLDHRLRRRSTELGLGHDEEAMECWRSVGVPDERIVLLGREDNFWQSGPPARAGPAPSSTSTAAWPSAAPTTARATTRSASSSSGTSCSCSTSCTRAARSPRCPRRTSTRGSGSSASRRSSRTCRRCSRRTSSGRSWRSARSARGAPTAATSPPRGPCASSPTTAAP